MAAQRYSTVAVVLHWTIAILIIGQIAGGFYMHNLPNSAAAKFDLYQLHKSFGLSIFALTILRLGWRLTHKPPALPDAMPSWQKLAARLTHWLFYFLLLATPLVGLAIVSVSPKDIPTEWFGLFQVPHLGFLNPGENPAQTEYQFIEVHEFLAYAILGLLVLHVGAALKHGFINRDGVLRSMAPRLGSVIGAALIFIALGAGAFLYFAGKNPPQVDVSTTEADRRLSPDIVEVAQEPAPAQELEEIAGADSAVVVAEGGAQDNPVEPVAAPEKELGMYGPCSREVARANWNVVRDGSALTFKGSQGGRPFEGRFGNFKTEISFDPSVLETSWISVTVNTSSAATGDQLTDSTIPGREWFDIKTHPEATFKSCEIKRAANGGYEAVGELSIKDVSREITLPFDVEISGATARAQGGVDLIRTDYDLGSEKTWLEDEGIALEVSVEFTVNAERAN